MFSDLEKKVVALKNQAVEKGFMTEDWQVILKIEDKPAKFLKYPQVLNHRSN